MKVEKRQFKRDIFPKLDLKAYKHKGYWYTSNTVKQAQEFDAAEFERNLG